MTSITEHENWPSVSAFAKQLRQLFDVQPNPPKDLGHKTQMIIHF